MSLWQGQAAIAGRTVWAVAPSHAEDETIALAAHETLRQTDPTALLIIAPRFPDRRDEIAQVCGNVTRSTGKVPGPEDPIWLFDTFGELGLVYRLSSLVLVGGTFSDIEGHNPWEAAILGAAITHGPRVANFATDFATLDEAGAAKEIEDTADLATILQGPSLHQMSDNATGLIDTASAQTDDLARQLMNLVDRSNG